MSEPTASCPAEGERKRPLRLGRHQRIRSRRDFDRAYRQGSRARGEHLLAVVVENGLDHPRLGLSVGKAIWKSAVRRNRVRRIFREAFRLSQHDLPSGVDLVLIPARKGLEPELEATRRELVQLAHKALRRQREKLARRAEAEERPA
jgi:ribonuclease P protein component